MDIFLICACLVSECHMQHLVTPWVQAEDHTAAVQTHTGPCQAARQTQGTACLPVSIAAASLFTPYPHVWPGVCDSFDLSPTYWTHFRLAFALMSMCIWETGCIPLN